jgi:hypothetical protein
VTRFPFVAYYTFCRKHETLKGQTPATSAGLSDHARTLRKLLEAAK